MAGSCVLLQLFFTVMMITNINGLSSPIPPFANYTHSISLLANTSDLFWMVNASTNEIVFELHMATTGWIALGISPADGMPGADIGVGWVLSSGQLVFQDRYAPDSVTLIIDNTTTDWFGIQGREQDGWTAIQSRRSLVTCDSMDVPIKSGGNILTFAWGPTDPDPSQTNGNIQYDQNRRGSLVVPLLSYSQPPIVDQLAGLDTVEFRVNNYTVPKNRSTFYCEVFKTPATFTSTRHAIAREILITSNDTDHVNYISLSECGVDAVFDDNNLPRGMCDANVTNYALCTYNIVIGWGTGGDNLVEFPKEAGLPIGLNFSTKYYMIQINYNNIESDSNYTDNSGVRLYIGNETRAYELGALTFGVSSSPSSLAIPPGVNKFSVDSYCTNEVSLSNFPVSGLTFFSFFGHTQSQGQSLWTKLIRNNTAVQYLFNDESYSSRYQFEHQLAQPIKVYQGDEFASRCVYNTMNKTKVTLGGRLPDEEMCVQIFNYYPRMSNVYTCASSIAPTSWQALMNATTPPNDATLSQWLLTINWTSSLATQWQEFYNNASRNIAFGRAGHYNVSFVASLPMYRDLNNTNCTSQQNNTNITGAPTSTVTTMTINNQTTINNISSTTVMSNVSTAIIANSSVETTMMGNSSVVTTMMANSSMATTMIANGSMATTMMANSSVVTTMMTNSSMAPLMMVNSTMVTTMMTDSSMATTTTVTSASNNLIIYRIISILPLLSLYLMNRIMI